jgi:tRNA A-37 threonylcarbamoyl transferase component Bud32
VSSTPNDALEVLQLIARRCVEMKTSFKVNADPFMHSYSISKRCGRGNAGKFAAIYPGSLEHCKELLDVLSEDLNGRDAIYILSDRPYRQSRSVFYRYGGFTSIKQLQPDGTKIPLIVGPDGESIPDQRLPYFHLPFGVTDPFSTEPPESDADDEPQVMAQRFEVRGALSFSNSGGVYKALDRETGNTVVLKEARPNVLISAERLGFIAATDLLQNEYEILERLRLVPGVVKPIAFFKEWEHWFLAEEYLRGAPLTNYRAHEDVMLLRQFKLPTGLQTFHHRFARIGLNLIDLVRAVHAQRVVLGDLSPNNVLVDMDTLDVRVIDVESAFTPETAARMGVFSAQWHTPGFRTAGRSTISESDDWFAVGMILHSLVLPTEPMFQLDPTARMRFLDRFVAAGLAPAVKRTISALFDAKVDEAQSELQRLGVFR